MILDRYIVKEVVPNVFIGLLVFTFVMLMNQIVLLAEILITRGVEFWMIFLIIFYSLPALTVLTIPMSLLLGTLLSLGRLQSDSELTVMRASGISFVRILMPIMSVGIVMWGIAAYLMMVSVPWSNYQLSKLMYKILTTNTARDLKPRVFYNQFTNMILYVQDIPSKENTWKGVMIYDESQPDKARLILAKEGVVHQKGEGGAMELQLKDGSWHEVDPARPDDYSYAYFMQNIFQLANPSQFNSADIPKGDREQTVPELKAKIRQYRHEHLNTRFLEVELHKKYAIPFACIVFTFLAVALGVSSKKGTRSSAYAVSIGIIVIYYIFLIGGNRLGEAGRISPFSAAWIGNIVLGSAGILLFLQANSSAISKLWQKIVAWKQKRALHPMVARTSGGRRVRVVVRIKRFPFRLFTLLDRYIVQEFIKNFLLILIALVLVAELIEATQLVDDLFQHKLPYALLFEYMKFHFPQWVFYVMPVTALTTTLVTLGLMTKNSEIIAMKSSGVSLYRISIPVIIVAAVLSVMAFWLQDYILPYTEKIAHNLHSQIKGQPPETYSTFERHWIGGSDGFFNYELFNVRKNIMYGFSIYQVDLQNFNLLKRVYAREASYSNGHWVLKHGWQRTFENGKVRYQQFNQQQAKLPVNPEYFKTEQELPAEMKFAELKHYIQKMRERGFDFVRFAVDLQAKISFPTVSLILTLIAIPFSFATGKRGALYGIGLSIVMGIVFWFFLALTKSLGYLEILNPFLAAWTPNILATLLALYLLFKIRT